MEDRGFNFIFNIESELSDTNIFQYTILGAKSVAMSLLIFKIINNFLQNTENPLDRKGWINIGVMMLLVLGSDYIIITIENIFNGVGRDLNLASTGEFFESFGKVIGTEMDIMFEGCEDTWDRIGTFISNIGDIMTIFLTTIALQLIRIGDMSLCAGHLLSRIFFIQMMKFIFPIVVALSTLEITKNLIWKWAKIYFGVLLLGVIYLGVIRFSNLLFDKILLEYMQVDNTGLNLKVACFGALLGGVMTFTTKSYLFRRTTDFIITFFS